MTTLKGEDKALIPIDVYCSLVRCALKSTTQGDSNNCSREMRADLNINATIQSLLKMTNDLENASKSINDQKEHSGNIKDGTTGMVRLASAGMRTEPSIVTMPVPPSLLKGSLRGDLRNSIDQVKREILEQFSLYNNLQEHDIPTRLEILSQHKKPSKEFDKAELGSYNVSTGVMEMVESLRLKFESTSQKIEQLERDLDSSINDPNLREWQYSRQTRTLNGGRDMEGMEDMCEHIRNMYGALHHQVKVNQQKIGALQKRLLTYTAHTRVLNNHQPQDKRVAL